MDRINYTIVDLTRFHLLSQSLVDLCNSFEVAVLEKSAIRVFLRYLS